MASLSIVLRGAPLLLGGSYCLVPTPILVKNWRIHYAPAFPRRIIADIFLFSPKIIFMKKHLFALICLTLVVVMQADKLSAQAADSHQHEIGMGISGSSFNGNVIYKWKKADNKFKRIQGSFGNFNLQNNSRLLFFSFNAGVAIGRENRKAVGAKTTFYRGPQFSTGLGFSKVEGFKPTWSISPRLGYIIGIQHDFNEYIAVNLEIVPSGGILLNKFSGQRLEFNINGGFNSNASLGLMYKF